jgi:hypothetical protein
VTPAAAGILRAFAGLVAGGVAVALVLVIALLVSGAHSLAVGSGSAALLSLGFACVSTALIVGLSDGLRAPALALVFAIATFWTATALPLWFAIPAALITGVVITADERARGGARIGGVLPVAALAGTGVWLLIVGAATAEPVAAPAAHAGAGAALLAPAKTRHAARSHPATRAKAPASHATAPASHAKAPASQATAPAPHAKAPTSQAKAPATPATGAPAPADFVRAYYANLNAHRFAAAWALLSPAVKARFGTFAHWRAGYATTLASAPENLSVSTAANGAATVSHALVARDKTPCGTLERRFAVTWTLVPQAGGWRVAGLSGRPTSSESCP